MGGKPQNANERRLAQLRVLKEQHFAEELTPEQIIAAKDARIQLLEDEVFKLRKRVNQLEASGLQSVSKQAASSRRAPLPETADEPTFDFYRS